VGVGPALWRPGHRKLAVGLSQQSAHSAGDIFLVLGGIQGNNWCALSHMNLKTVFVGCMVLIAVTQSGVGLGGNPVMLAGESESRNTQDTHQAVSSCRELRLALQNESVDTIIVDGHLVCPQWEEPVQIGRQVYVEGRNKSAVHSSIDFTGNGCAFELLEKSSLWLTNMVLIHDTVEMGLFPPLCRSFPPDSSVMMENISVGVRSCGGGRAIMPNEDLVLYESRLCEFQKGIEFVEFAKIMPPGEVTRFEMEIHKIAFICGVDSFEDAMDLKGALPVFCNAQVDEKRNSLNTTVFYVVGFIVPVFVILVFLGVILKKKLKEKICNKMGDWQGMLGSSNSLFDVVQNLGIYRTQSSFGGVDSSQSKKLKKTQPESDGTSLSVGEVPIWDYISLHDIQMEEPIGKGQFSTVHKGSYKGVPVALKMIEHTGKVYDKVPLEAQLSKNIDHPNVVNTLLDETHKRSNHLSGLFTSMNLGQADCFASEESLSLTGDMFSEFDGAHSMTTGYSLTPPHRDENHEDTGDYVTWIVMEYCDKGPLSHALHNNVFCYAGKERQPKMAHILLTAMDIASAMRCLHMKGIIHGDLKAQNCLLKSDPTDTRGFVCKVGDFGFSRKIEINTHIQTFTCGTVSHQPPELLRDGILTPAADVYAFGILLWQLVMCEAPYQNMTNQRIVVSVVEGRRPPIPQNCPLAYSLLIQECWHQEHKERPSFQHIFNRLTEMMSGWGQSQDTMFQTGFQAAPVDMDSCQSLEHIRLAEPHALSWLSNDFDRRCSLSSEVLMWTNTSANTLPGTVHKPSPVQPRGQPMLQGSGSNPLYRCEPDVRMPDPINDNSIDSPNRIHSLSLMARGSMESIALNRDHQITGFPRTIFMSPRP